MVKAMVKGRVIDMAKDSHKPPSRIRYEQTHPVVSIRVDQDTAKTLKEISETTGKSLGQLIKENLKIQKITEKDIQKRVQQEYDKGADDYEIWYYCARCGEKIIISPNSRQHKAVIEYMKEHRWGHKNC